MSEFKFGDRVVYVRPNAPKGGPRNGDIGTVLDYQTQDRTGYLVVDFDNEIELGYQMNLKRKVNTRDKHGWMCWKGYLKKIDCNPDEPSIEEPSVEDICGFIGVVK